MADFYTRVDAAAAPHGVRKVEARGDCCICVADGESAPSSTPATWRGQVAAVLAFASALHADLSARAPQPGAGRRAAAATRARMGVATGPVAFLLGDPAASPTSGGGGTYGGYGGDVGGGFSSIQVRCECACVCVCVCVRAHMLPCMHA